MEIMPEPSGSARHVPFYAEKERDCQATLHRRRQHPLQSGDEELIEAFCRQGDEGPVND